MSRWTGHIHFVLSALIQHGGWPCRLIVLATLILTHPTALRSQQSDKLIVLEHADRLEGKIIDGEEVQELIGHVRLRQGTVTVNCERAIRFMVSKKISLVGNVIVRDDTITMKGRRGMYYNAERIAEAFDSVQLNDGTTTLTAQYGRYYADEKKAFFRDSVSVWDPVSTLKSNELTYYREGKRSIAVGNVQIHNVEDGVTIYGGYFENYGEQKFSRMTQQPRLIQLDTLEGRIDSFTVSSRMMESYRDSVRRLVATDSVAFASADLAGEAGQVVYLTERDSIIMRKKPFIWYEESQVSGDSMFIRLEKRKPERVYVRGDAFAISLSDIFHPKRFNQLTGASMTMFFEQGDIQRIDVARTATSVYCLYEEQNDTLRTIMRRPNGINKTTGDHVTIHFLDGRAERISVAGGVQGEYFPENVVEGRESDYYLPGFNWRQDHPGTWRRLPIPFPEKTPETIRKAER